MSEIVEVTEAIRAELVERAATLLRDGELVVLPTDTVYGVAADAFSLDGTARIFAARSQPRKVPLPVMVRSPKQLIGLTPTVPKAADRLMAAFWPGPLTLVVLAEPNLRWELGRSEGTLAVRMPLDDLALEIISAVGPLAVTSAAPIGAEPPATAAVASDALGASVSLYLDEGERDGMASTVVDLTRAEPHVLRVGALPADLVLAVARGELDPLEAAAAVAAGSGADPSSGAGGDAAGTGGEAAEGGTVAEAVDGQRSGEPGDDAVEGPGDGAGGGPGDGTRGRG